MTNEAEIRKLSFEQIKELLTDPFRVLVEEGRVIHICAYGQDSSEVLEEVSISTAAHDLIRQLSRSNIIHKAKWGQNIISDIPDFASFYDIHRGDIYGIQTEDEYQLAKSLELAESR
ncbi:MULTISPECIES: hypothetical protein [Alteromonadales]|uniref:Ubiquinone/menaquinone biosynthesis C-methylase UbiE n=4 Tax=Alteromonadales TaxID=135622 RepID=A0A7X0TUF9_9GAMM|nr:MULTISPECIES: hypothetical protein [Alteromonadales]MBB6544337.1 ubiquinone/menaquinone biosynthesis C-methylase UbiE [Thalassotalea piscium]MCF2948828.1 hypothetical protein [Paraglaciecola sp. G1-23]MDN4504096.1 hypothetical protein [Alteromonadaceae bacterium BrNp21-10]GHE92723.1 hypothetical protein GCM10011501_22810 [Thalassotalea profundi]